MDLLVPLKPTLRDLFRFLLVSGFTRIVFLLSFFRFFFWKNVCEAKRSKPQQESESDKHQIVKSKNEKS